MLIATAEKFLGISLTFFCSNLSLTRPDIYLDYKVNGWVRLAFFLFFEKK